MARQIRTAPGPIWAAVKARLINQTGLGTNRVLFMRTRRWLPHFTGDQDVVLWPRGFTSIQATNDAAGRVDTRLRQRLTVVVRTRLATDDAGTDERWFLDDSYGHTQLLLGVIDALHEFWPVDKDANVLTYEPMRVLDGSDYEEDPKVTMWGSSGVDFEVSYEAALTATDFPWG